MESILVAMGFNLLDIATGTLAAFKNKSLESSKLRDGIFKKVGYVLIYVAAWLLDNKSEVIGFDLGFNVLPAVIAYVIYTEIVSFAENISKINPDLLPSKILSLLSITQESEGTEMINMLGEVVNEEMDNTTVNMDGTPLPEETTEVTEENESYEVDNNAEPTEEDIMLAEAEESEVEES